MPRNQAGPYLGSAPSSGDETECREHPDRQDTRWGALEANLVRRITCLLTKRATGSARLMSPHWAAEVSASLTRLEVKGKGPAGWGKHFDNIEDLHWVKDEEQHWAWLCRDNAGRSWPSLRSLRLGFATDRDLRMLGEMRGLVSLDLSTSRNITDTGMQQLTHLSSLTSLSLSSCSGITDASLLHLSHMSDLTSLKLGRCGSFISDKGLEAIGRLSSLTYLSLASCQSIGLVPPWFEELKQLPALATLNMAGCRNVEERILKEISLLPSLTSLVLIDCQNVSDKGLRHLTRLSTLTSIDLACCCKITDTGLAGLLEATPSLASLNLGCCKQIGNAGLLPLQQLSGLTSLNLSYCLKIGDDTLPSLSTSLTSLNLTNCSNLTNIGLSCLGRLSSLTSLNLENCKQLMNHGLVKIVKNNTALASLNLVNCKSITDEGLLHVAHLPSLTSLDLRGCSFNFTPEGGMAIMTKNPSLVVHYAPHHYIYDGGYW